MFFSSHQIAEVDQIVDHVAIIDPQAVKALSRVPRGERDQEGDNIMDPLILVCLTVVVAIIGVVAWVLRKRRGR